jgi:hypothetical protein
MQFRLTGKTSSFKWFKWQLIRKATFIALRHKLKPSEYKLNEYLKKNYNKDLKTAALYLIKNCTIIHNFQNEAVVIFQKKEDDTLASLITYGNLEVGGSDLLKRIFFRKE